MMAALSYSSLSTTNLSLLFKKTMSYGNSSFLMAPFFFLVPDVVAVSVVVCEVGSVVVDEVHVFVLVLA